MTLPTSGTITTDMLLAELRVRVPSRTYPLSLTDPDVLALAGRTTLPVVMPVDFYGKSSYTPMTVQAYGDSAYRDSSTGSGIIYAYPSVSVSGGQGDKTYLWKFVSATSGVQLINPTSPNCAVRVNYGKTSDGSASATLTCTVTDAAGASVTSAPVDVYLEWSNGNV